MNKKIISAFLIPVIMFSFCACGRLPFFKNINSFLVDNIYIDWENFSSEKSLDKGSLYKNYFDNLSTDQKKAYNNILYEVMDAEDEYPKRIEVPLIGSDELTEVYEAVAYDNPEIMCFGTGGNIVTEGELCFFEPDYTMIPSEQKWRTENLEEKAAELFTSFSSDTSDFEKELAIHDYLIKICDYDCDSEDSSSAYSCIFNGYASCEGYAKATKYLMEKAGIECYNIVGEASTEKNGAENHMWNIVNIGGNYYHLDTTWDDPAEKNGGISHIYFNLTEDEIKTDHSKFSDEFICENKDENYFTKTGSLFHGADNQSISEMEKLTVKNLEKGIKCVQLRFDSEETYNEAVNILIDQSRAYDIQRNIKYYRSDLNISEQINYSRCDSFCVLVLIF